MILSITGTPGTGKNTVSKIVAKELGWRLVDLNATAKRKNLFKGYDQKRKCEIVDLEKLNSEIKKTKKDSIIQSHYSHELSADLIVVLRTEQSELRKRLEKRGWPKEKIEENIEAEIMEICKDEALQKTKKVFEIDTTAQKPENSAEEIINTVFREGFEIKKDLKIPDKLLGYFKKPYGKLFSSTKEFIKSGLSKKNKGLLINVGDQSAYSLLQSGISLDIIVIDNKVRRQPFKGKIDFNGKELKAVNRLGIMGRSLWTTVKKSISLASGKEKIKVVVAGEDDLAVLPYVIMAPLGSVILYGQPELDFEGEKIEGGLVAIKVDLEKKNDAVRLLREMERFQK